ncbi:glycosyltransferase [Polynucleobacter sp. Adler-ghost]|uniref:glycosyltransferase n=1 Tax=Polynucleobacter sp. Adler-ghost TaxID=2770234 RepID=UPI001BFD748C|nr:glycosyltransferase [Polynucleobacter sp. Adler-ghost]
MSKLYKIKLIILQGNKLESNSDLAELRNLGIDIYLMRITIPEIIINLLISAFDPTRPFQCSFFTSRNSKKLIENLLVKYNISIVYLVTARVLFNFKSFKYLIFLDLIDSFALNFHRRFLNTRNLILKLLFYIEYCRLIKLEDFAVTISYRCFLVSSIDKNYINPQLENVIVIPIGVYNFNHERKIYSPGGNFILTFSGNMNYQPNILAVLWFYSNCWKILECKHYNLRLKIIGSNPPHSISILSKNPKIEVTGRVPSVYDELNASHLSIAPMLTGSGMQFKILEAMMCGLPVVTTPLGLGDIRGILNHNILIANTPSEFIDIISSAIMEYETFSKIGENGSIFVKEHHSWSVINSLFMAEFIDV